MVREIFENLGCAWRARASSRPKGDAAVGLGMLSKTSEQRKVYIGRSQLECCYHYCMFEQTRSIYLEAMLDRSFSTA